MIVLDAAHAALVAFDDVSDAAAYSGARGGADPAGGALNRSAHVNELTVLLPAVRNVQGGELASAAVGWDGILKSSARR
jgi:hypothetical protein